MLPSRTGGNSSLRDAIRRANKARFHPAVAERIKDRRLIFKALPIAYITDLEQGALFWTYASFLSTVIPLFPLASLYEGWWHVESDVSRPHYTVIFSLFIFMGLAYTIGSYFFHRAVRHPHVPPLLTWYHMSTDELASMWWFMLGTVPSIPVCAIYCYYYGSLGQYGLALAISIVCSIVMVVAVLATYPTDGEHSHREFFTPVVKYFFGTSPFIITHFGSDWLIISWVFLVMAALAVFASGCMLIYALSILDGFEIFNFGTGFVDCILFFIGCMYVLAGSYGSPDDTILEPYDEENAPPLHKHPVIPCAPHLLDSDGQPPPRGVVMVVDDDDDDEDIPTSSTRQTHSQQQNK